MKVKSILSNIFFVTIVILSLIQCDEKGEKIRALITGHWILTEQIENGVKQDYRIQIDYLKGGNALLVQYDKKNREIYRSNAQWKINDKADTLIWYNDKDVPDQNWKIITLTASEMSIKMQRSDGEVSRKLKKENP